MTLSDFTPKQFTEFSYMSSAYFWAASNWMNQRLLQTKEIKIPVKHLASFTPFSEKKLKFVFRYSGKGPLSKSVIINAEKDALEN